MTNSIKTRRLFFALWPTNQVRHSIVETFSQLPRQKKGRVMQPQNLHETLHFVGQVTESTKDCMHAVAQSVNAEVFQLDLDCFGYFPKAKILWIGSQTTPDQLMQLHKKLGVALEDCGFTTEKRPFSPHVTLMRKCSKPDNVPPGFSIPWHVEEFVLIESITYNEGVHYQVIEKYPLQHQ